MNGSTDGPGQNVNAAILRTLREASGSSVSGAELALRIGVPRAAVWTHIDELRELGYDIQASPHLGYQLVSVPDILNADDLQSLTQPAVRVIGREIRVLHETKSTNDIVGALARNGSPEGCVVFAESQTHGRGRLSRKWISPAGKGLWFSILLRPRLPPQSVTRLTITAAVGLARGIRRATGLTSEIKWPNDLLIRGRKVAGILTEMSAETDKIHHIALGIGINVNFARDDFPPALRATATSLSIAAGHTWPRAQLAADLLTELDRTYAQMDGPGFEIIADEWESACSTLGQSVSIQTGNRTVTGRAESLDSDGALLVRSQYGHLDRILGGDVTQSAAEP